MTWTTVYDQTSQAWVTGTSSSNDDDLVSVGYGCWMRMRIPSSAWLQAVAGNQVRVTIAWHANSGACAHALADSYFGQAAAVGSWPNVNPFTGDQVQLTWGGVITADSTAGASFSVSDAITLAQNFDNTKDYLFSVFWYGASGFFPHIVKNDAGPSTDFIKDTSGGDIVTDVAGSTNDPASISASETNHTAAIVKVEINVAGAPPPLMGQIWV